jgi:hypothetical protein
LPIDSYLSLLSPESHLGGHDALSFGYERALGAGTIPPAAVALVSLQGRDDAVIAAAGALGRPLVALGSPEEHSGGGSGRRRWNSSVMVVVMSRMVLLAVMLLVVVAVMLMRRAHVSGKSGKESVRTHHAVGRRSGTSASAASVAAGHLMPAIPMR